MNASREAAAERVARLFLPRAALLTRLLVKQADWDITRSEAGLLSALQTAPQRITALADLEGLAQPTVTLLVKRLGERGWVTRERDALDGRAVLVSITAPGLDALEGFRAQYHALLRELLAELDDERLAALEQATDALAELVQALQESAAAGPRPAAAPVPSP